MDDCGLRDAEPAEGAADRTIRVDRPRRGAHRRHDVGARRVHRDSVGHRRSPRGVGAGVEVAVEVEGGEPTVGVGTERGGHHGRVALGRRTHRLRTRVDAADRSIEHPGRDRDQRLDRHVELAAEPAAARRRHDADALWGDAQDQRDLVAVHVGRLGRDDDCDPVTLAHRVAGFGLDVRVLDVARAERPGRGRRRAGQGRCDVAASDPPARQDVAGRRLVELPRAAGARRRPGRSAARGVPRRSAPRRPRWRRSSPRRRPAPRPPRRGTGRSRRRGPADPCPSHRCRSGSGPGHRRRAGLVRVRDARHAASPGRRP